MGGLDSTHLSAFLWWELVTPTDTSESIVLLFKEINNMNYYYGYKHEDLPASPDIDWRTWTVRKENEYYSN
jgi:hypothetical protein